MREIDEVQISKWLKLIVFLAKLSLNADAQQLLGFIWWYVLVIAW